MYCIVTLNSATKIVQDFIQSLGNPKNAILPLIFNLTCSDLSTLTGQNVKFLMTKLEKQTLSSLIDDRLAIKKARVSNLNEDETWKIQLIKEHLEIAFDDEDLEEILMFICTD